MSKLTHGVGYNSKRKHKVKSNGIDTIAYVVWRDMITRCYSTKEQLRRPNYAHSDVDERWHDFQDFADWYYSHPYSDIGYQLDKDILVPGNKIYSPDTCCFVPMQINVIFTNRAACRGSYPQGVTLSKRNSNFVARLMVNGKKNHLGCFDTPEEAYQVYKIAKEAYVKEKALEWQGRIADNVFQALMNWTLDSQ